MLQHQSFEANNGLVQWATSKGLIELGDLGTLQPGLGEKFGGVVRVGRGVEVAGGGLYPGGSASVEEVS